MTLVCAYVALLHANNDAMATFFSILIFCSRCLRDIGCKGFVPPVSRGGVAYARSGVVLGKVLWMSGWKKLRRACAIRVPLRDTVHFNGSGNQAWAVTAAAVTCGVALFSGAL